MEQGNQTFAPGFILQGLFHQAGHEGLIFGVLLFVYLLILQGNLLIVLLICCDTRMLHTPMYFFLSFLALADICFASSTIPIMLRNLISQDRVISYHGCFFQMYCFLAFGNTDNFLLATMAYDRYVAICCPLHYKALMNTRRCLLMVSGSWLLALFQATLYTSMLSSLSFCTSREIPHFFCEFYPVLGLACSDTTAVKLLALTEGVLDFLGPFIFIVASYLHIFVTIMKTSSSSSKHRSFSTCGSHLSVVILFYGTLCWIYTQPTSKNKVLPTLMYTVVTPMLNPFIYSLRNNEMKRALRRLLSRVSSFIHRNWK
ncbi:olfactory receptor 7C1-like [Sphaerodactylus townsendi]|uniref:olfactory receptor 7C1-like n=1 Tax=Sphaerodactylus townsendi TaxID=933632 RepID=UPI0020264327|nr:olfactory receptor 7C1-like [Sphaerodactylus townsendi]